MQAIILVSVHSPALEVKADSSGSLKQGSLQQAPWAAPQRRAACLHSGSQQQRGSGPPAAAASSALFFFFFFFFFLVLIIVGPGSV